MTDTQELRKLAEAATPGPWAFGTFHRLLVVPFWKGVPDKRNPIADFGLGDISWTGDKQAHHNAVFVASANPTTIIALLDALEAAQAENAANMATCKGIIQGLTAELGDLPEAQTDMLHTIKELRARLAAGEARIECNTKVLQDMHEEDIKEIERLKGHIKHIGNDAMRAENAELRARLAELEGLAYCLEAILNRHGEGSTVADVMDSLDRLAELEKQEPVAIAVADVTNTGYLQVRVHADAIKFGDKLYAAAGASPVQPSQVDMEYTISLQRAIELHCDGKSVPESVSAQCPHHAKMLNDKLVQPSQTGEPTEAQLVAGVKAMRLFVTKNSVKDFRDGFIAAINAKESK